MSKEKVNYCDFHIVELSDNEYRILSTDELEEIQSNAIEYDGFSGMRYVGVLASEIIQTQTERERKLYEALDDITNNQHRESIDNALRVLEEYKQNK